MSNSPILYLLIEEAARELHSRLLIARFALERGWRVVIGQQWLLNANWDVLPHGTVLFKGNNGVQAWNMAKARQAGFRVVSIEEEALGLSDAREIDRLYADDLPSKCDLFLVQGDFQGDCLARRYGERYPGVKDRIVVTGNPRVDLLREEFRGPVAERAAALTRDHGRFLLINTNYASINPRRGDTLSYLRICENAGVIERNNESDMADFRTWCAWEQTNMAEMVALIERLTGDGFDLPIILRPHPSENLENWERAWDGIPGIKVIREGDYLAWCMAAEAVVHTSCTTGLEAELLDCPALSLKPGDNPWHDLFVVNLVNDSATTHAEARAWLDSLVAGERPANDGRSRAALAPHLRLDRDRLSADLVVEAIAGLAPIFGGRKAWPDDLVRAGSADWQLNKISTSRAEFEVELAWITSVLAGPEPELAELAPAVFMLSAPGEVA